MEDIITIDSNDRINTYIYNWFRDNLDKVWNDYVRDLEGQMYGIYHSLDINEAYGSDLEKFLNKM